jgi:ferredoxin
MERQKLSLVPVGCRGGGCGICRVRVIEGTYRTGKMSRRHVSEEDLAKGYALACRLYPTSDLVLVYEQGSAYTGQPSVKNGEQ